MSAPELTESAHKRASEEVSQSGQVQRQYETPKKSAFNPSGRVQSNFNPEKKRNKVDSEEAQKLRRIINTNQRSEEDARILYEHIKDFQFFETFNDRNEDS